MNPRTPNINLAGGLNRPPKRIAATDIIVYVYTDAAAPPRGERLAPCAAHYAQARGLIGGGFTPAVNTGGKPWFPARPEVNFSISHSGCYWLAAFHSKPLGLDIQAQRQVDHLAIAKRWYHAEEYAAVLQNGPACFFDIWSAKESRCKMNGAGINSSFPRFSVVADGAIALRGEGYQLRQIRLFKDHSLCLCAACIGEIYIEDCRTYSGRT